VERQKWIQMLGAEAMVMQCWRLAVRWRSLPESSACDAGCMRMELTCRGPCSSFNGAKGNGRLEVCTSMIPSQKHYHHDPDPRGDSRRYETRRVLPDQTSDLLYTEATLGRCYAQVVTSPSFKHGTEKSDLCQEEHGPFAETGLG